MAAERMERAIRKPVVNIKVIGVGGGGNSVLLRIAEDRKLFDVELIGINTDKKTLRRLDEEGIRTVAIGESITGGRGTGSNIELGANAARIDERKIAQAIQGANLVFITAGMGAGVGTGAAPVVAKVARDMGIMTIGVVTVPFSWEGKRKLMIAQSGIDKMKGCMDALITVKNDNLLKLPEYKSMSLVDAFKAADNILRQAIECIADTILTTGKVNVDFADVRTILCRNTNNSDVVWGIGEDENGSVVKAVEAAISSPLIERPLRGARGIILNIFGSEDISIFDVNDASQYINSRTSPDVDLIFGVVTVPEMGTKVRATIIAADFEGGAPPIAPRSVGLPGKAMTAKELLQQVRNQKKEAAPAAEMPAVRQTAPASNVNQAQGLDLTPPSFMTKPEAAKAEEKKDEPLKPIGLGRMTVPRWSNDFGKDK